MMIRHLEMLCRLKGESTGVKEFRKYISKIDRVSICNNDTLAYRNYQFIEDVPDDYDEMYFYGVGMIKSEFP